MPRMSISNCERKDELQSLHDFLSLQTARSPRAVGDALELLVAEKGIGAANIRATSHVEPWLIWRSPTRRAFTPW